MARLEQANASKESQMSEGSEENDTSPGRETHKKRKT